MARRTDHNWAIGELADGTIDSFPLSELPRRQAELAAQEKMIDRLIALMQQGLLDAEQLRRPLSDLSNMSDLLDEVLGGPKKETAK
jgi:hypothetical protein